MSKHLIRLVALFLVPGLIADPVTASAFTTASTAFSASARVLSLSRFEQEALAATPVAHREHRLTMLALGVPIFSVLLVSAFPTAVHGQVLHFKPVAASLAAHVPLSSITVGLAAGFLAALTLLGLATVRLPDDKDESSRGSTPGVPKMAESTSDVHWLSRVRNHLLWEKRMGYVKEKIPFESLLRYINDRIQRLNSASTDAPKDVANDTSGQKRKGNFGSRVRRRNSRRKDSGIQGYVSVSDLILDIFKKTPKDAFSVAFIAKRLGFPEAVVEESITHLVGKGLFRRVQQEVGPDHYQYAEQTDSPAGTDDLKPKGMIDGSLAAWVYEFAQKYVKWFPLQQFLMSLGYALLAPIREAHFFMEIFEDIWKDWDVLKKQFKGASTEKIQDHLFELIGNAAIKSLKAFRIAHHYGYVGNVKIDLNPEGKTPEEQQRIERIRNDLRTLHGYVFGDALERIALALSEGSAVNYIRLIVRMVVISSHSVRNIRAHQEDKVVGMADQPLHLRDAPSAAPEGVVRTVDDLKTIHRPWPKILVLRGPTGSGKSMLVDRLIQNHPDDFMYLRRTVTRERKANERDDQRVFVGADEFSRMQDAGEFVFSQDLYEYKMGVTAADFSDVWNSGKIAIFEAIQPGFIETLQNIFPGIEIHDVFVSPGENPAPILRERIASRTPSIDRDTLDARVHLGVQLESGAGNANLIIRNGGNTAADLPYAALETFIQNAFHIPAAPADEKNGGHAISRETLRTGLKMALVFAAYSLGHHVFFADAGESPFRVLGMSWAAFVSLFLMAFIFLDVYRQTRETMGAWTQTRAPPLLGFQDTRFDPSVEYMEVFQDPLTHQRYLAINPSLLKSSSRWALFGLRLRLYLTGVAVHEALHGLGFESEVLPFSIAQFAPILVATGIGYVLGGWMSLLLVTPLAMVLFSGSAVFLNAMNFSRHSLPRTWNEILHIRPLVDEFRLYFGYAAIANAYFLNRWLFRMIALGKNHALHADSLRNVLLLIWGVAVWFFIASINSRHMRGLVDLVDGKAKFRWLTWDETVFLMRSELNRSVAYVLILVLEGMIGVYWVGQGSYAAARGVIWASWLGLLAVYFWNTYVIRQHNLEVKWNREEGHPEGVFMTDLRKYYVPRPESPVSPEALYRRSLQLSGVLRKYENYFGSFDSGIRRFRMFFGNAGVSLKVHLSALIRNGLLREEVAQQIGSSLPPDAHVLSVGEGSGVLLAEIQRWLPRKASLWGLDIAPSLLKRAQALGIVTLMGDGDYLPFADASLDVVIFSESLGHLNNRMALAEAFRVLKPGGQVYLTSFRRSFLPKMMMFFLFQYETDKRSRIVMDLHQAGFNDVSPIPLKAEDKPSNYYMLRAVKPLGTAPLQSETRRVAAASDTPVVMMSMVLAVLALQTVVDIKSLVAMGILGAVIAWTYSRKTWIGSFIKNVSLWLSAAFFLQWLPGGLFQLPATFVNIATGTVDDLPLQRIHLAGGIYLHNLIHTINAIDIPITVPMYILISLPLIAHALLAYRWLYSKKNIFHRVARWWPILSISLVIDTVVSRFLFGGTVDFLLYMYGSSGESDSYTLRDLYVPVILISFIFYTGVVLVHSTRWLIRFIRSRMGGGPPSAVSDPKSIAKTKKSKRLRPQRLQGQSFLAAA